MTSAGPAPTTYTPNNDNAHCANTQASATYADTQALRKSTTSSPGQSGKTPPAQYTHPATSHQHTANPAQPARANATATRPKPKQPAAELEPTPNGAAPHDALPNSIQAA
jgi:hypothetical protein